MTEEIKLDETHQLDAAPKAPVKTKRDILRFEGDIPTAVNLEHVSSIYMKECRISFEFYNKVQHIDFDNESAAKAAFDSILTTWAADVVG